ncbi:MAG: glycosyltransferase, partial [Desulfobulbaceae bacterium]|nr:glycosyltransferase [Desulfobulbaceae bacterium]
MRIVIDMQGAQTESRYRGIGRYSMSLAQAIVRNQGEHEIILALSGLFPETIEPIRAAFDGLLPQENIRVWQAPGPVRECEPGNEQRRQTAELIREAFLVSLQPDIIHVMSLFEGFVDDAVTSIGRFDRDIPVSCTMYDLIPLIYPEKYFTPNPFYAEHYQRKIEDIRHAFLLLAISESARDEALDHLSCSEHAVVNTYEAVDERFCPQQISEVEKNAILDRFGIAGSFLLYTGGSDIRKNLPRLIHAYARMPRSLRISHQLVLSGRMPAGDMAQLKDVVRSSRLEKDRVIFTSYISDDGLVQLYNLCTLYVFPSLHEGFGLPVLEAMACGTAVIGANTSSVPEVIGRQDSLFDPYDEVSISGKMAEVLGNSAFRSELEAHGLEQARRFSWDETARKTIAAWENLHYKSNRKSCPRPSSITNRLITALAKQLPTASLVGLPAIAACVAQNQHAGIKRQLLVDVSELAQRDAATGVQRVVRSYLKALLQSPPDGFIVEPVYASLDQGYRYARCFTQHFLGRDSGSQNDDPVQWQRGDIFFGLDMQHHVQLAHRKFYQQLRAEGAIVKFLIHDLLPIQLANFFYSPDAGELHEQWLTMIAGCDGAVCVSKATADAFGDWLGQNNVRRSPNFQLDWVHIGGDLENSQPSCGMPENAGQALDSMNSRPTFLSVATLEPRKGQQQIIDAVELLWEEGADVNLVFVGQQGWKVESLVERLSQHPEKDQRLFWLRGISDEYLEKIYAVCTCLVAASINEGFGLPLVEAARHNIPIIARDIPVFHEVAGACAHYFSGESAHDLSAALKEWLVLYRDERHPKSDLLRWSTWEESAEKLKEALVSKNYSRRQLMVDISELVQRDVGSGIQRVVRSVLKEWLSNPPSGYRVEPVYATVDQGYRYARRFTQRFMGCPDDILQDEPIEYASGDVFFGLDFQPQVVAAQRPYYQALRRQGVRVEFLVHDLLCIQMSQYFVPGSAEGFTHWLEVVAENDGVVCVSRGTADDMAAWIKENSPPRQRPFNINWSHNGVDVDNSLSSKGLPPEADGVLNHLRSRLTFLMVGTIEPRKAHALVLSAFEQLWQVGEDVNLVIVGKEGWMVEKLVDRIRSHPELNKRLCWLEGIS